MATVNYTVRLDETDRQVAEQVFHELGLTMAEGLNVYLKAVARQRRIPFDLALNADSLGVTRAQKEKSAGALADLLAGHEVELDKEREERILST